MKPFGVHFLLRRAQAATLLFLALTISQVHMPLLCIMICPVSGIYTVVACDAISVRFIFYYNNLMRSRNDPIYNYSSFNFRVYVICIYNVYKNNKHRCVLCYVWRFVGFNSQYNLIQNSVVYMLVLRNITNMPTMKWYFHAHIARGYIIMMLIFYHMIQIRKMTSLDCKIYRGHLAPASCEIISEAL